MMNVLTFKDGEREEDLFKYHLGEELRISHSKVLIIYPAELIGEELRISHSKVLIIYPAELINCVYYFSFH